jgi:aminotransferase
MQWEQRVAQHVRNIPRSGIRDFFEVVQKIPDVVSLGIGEPDFVTPWHIREAAIYALESGKTGYTSNLGLPKLRNCIARYLEKHFELSYNPETEIIITVGVSEGMDIAFRALLNPGDEVLYHEPCYVSYHPGIQLAHGKPVPIPCYREKNFLPSIKDLEARVSKRTKILVLNFPTNPTGANPTLAQLRAIANFAVKHDLIVFTDEIYAELTYEGRHRSIACFPGMKDRTIFFHGFSKAWAMTGFRLGYACAPDPIIEAMMRVHQYSMLCAPILSQEAAIEALNRGDQDVERMKEDYRLRRNYLVKELQNMGLDCQLPRGAFYAFPSVKKTGYTSRDFSLSLLKKHKVAVVPGEAFGASGEGHVRCSFTACMADIEKAVERMKQFLK